MITRLIWTPMPSVPEKADKLSLARSLSLSLSLSRSEPMLSFLNHTIGENSS